MISLIGIRDRLMRLEVVFEILCAWDLGGEQLLAREPGELCLHARDECAACAKPVVAPADQSEQHLLSRDLAQQLDDLDAVTEVEQRGAIRALRVDHPIDDEVAQRRQRGAEAGAMELELE